jgi:hypothetical protein
MQRKPRNGRDSDGENWGFFCRMNSEQPKMDAVASGKRLTVCELERSTMLLMGKSTISTGPFSIAKLVNSKVYDIYMIFFYV